MGAITSSRTERSFVSDTEVTFDETVDIAVIGAGAAGLSAALNAADAGKEVLVLEAADFVGGTARKPAAWYWMPNGRAQAAQYEPLTWLNSCAHPAH